jgi:hypothetical protein
MQILTLSDRSGVSLSSFHGLGEVNSKSDTLLKPKRSFKIYLKRNGKIIDSGKHTKYYFPSSWVIRKVY